MANKKSKTIINILLAPLFIFVAIVILLSDMLTKRKEQPEND